MAQSLYPTTDSTMTDPTIHFAAVAGVKLAYHEWHATPDNAEPPLIIAHATGFHGRCYSAIAERFDGRRVIALDLHGHGQSEGGPVEDWRVIAAQVSGLLTQLGINGAVGVGHSMGAHTLTQCAADHPELFARLVLFDPVILAPEYYAVESPLFTADEPHPTIRRKRDFDTPEAMIKRFATRDPYDIFDRRVFEDYCRHGLVPTPDGRYELACSPEVEASLYGSSRSNAGIHDAARQVAAPTLVVRAKQTGLMDFKGSPTWPELASLFPKGTDMPRPDMTHFHPFEDPADAAHIITEFECA